MNALMGVTDPDVGPLKPTSADLTMMFMPNERSDAEIVHPVMMSSSRCHADVSGPEETLYLRLFVLIQNMFWI